LNLLKGSVISDSGAAADMGMGACSGQAMTLVAASKPYAFFAKNHVRPSAR
jgi:hypothetical protein